MRKVLSLFLAFVMCLSLVACRGTETGSNETINAASATNPTTAPTSEPTTPPTTKPPDSERPYGPEPVVKFPYQGKKIQIYGMGDADSYTNYDIFGKGNYLWMMKAAMEEWAAMNGVTIEFKGSFNQGVVLAEMAAGIGPDLFFQSNNFPSIANLGMTSAFTDAEYKKLAEVCGEGYLDLMTYKTNSHGFVFPWAGSTVCYYNKSMIERYGVKSPKEYFMEGNWTWETFMKCMEEMTRDVDNDGVIDTYGLPADSFNNLVNPWKTNDKGELVSPIDDPMMQDFFQLKYDAYAVKKIVQQPGKNRIQNNVIYPMCAMQISDCEHYNFEYLYQTLPNGDELEVVPVPQWVSKNGEKQTNICFTQAAAHLACTCDEREAVVDMLAYVLQCGMKYISDYSLGAVKCDYPGIQGTCDLSKQWKEAFQKVCADRRQSFGEIVFDWALFDDMCKIYEGAEWYTYQGYSGVTALTDYREIIHMPPASSIPAIKEKYQAQLNEYNRYYVK